MFLFEHACVRDLAWAIGSCPLIKSLPYLPCVSELDCWSWYEHFLPHLQALDLDPQVLMSRLAELSSTRLGNYFGALIEYWLMHRTDIESLQSRILISHQQRTLGELDFVYFFKDRQEIVHWEIAVKFYLKYQDMDGKVFFIGPNPEDQLRTKLTQLQRQLEFDQHPLVQEWLATHYRGRLLRNSFIKGYLFYPWGETLTPLSFPPEAHENHLRGWWLFYHSLAWRYWCETAQEESLTRWLILPKLSWLSPACIFKDAPSIGLNAPQCIRQIKRHFHSYSSCLLIAQLQQDNDGNWVEVNRGFVVPSRWGVS